MISGSTAPGWACRGKPMTLRMTVDSITPMPATVFATRFKPAKNTPSERRPVDSSLSSTTSATMAAVKILEEMISATSIV